MGYGSNEGNGAEKDRFWYKMDRILDKVRNAYRLCILGDLNRWIGDRARASITGAFGIPGGKDNGRKWWSSVLKRDCVWVTHTLSTGICISTQGW